MEIKMKGGGERGGGREYKLLYNLYYELELSKSRIWRHIQPL
jgi:hypothetical protein